MLAAPPASVAVQARLESLPAWSSRSDRADLVQASVLAEFKHVCGLTPSGEAYCWGSNSSGELGDGTRTDRAIPTPVAGGLSFIAISVGNERSCGITTEGSAYCWGRNHWGAIGNGMTEDRAEPPPVAGSLSFQSISVGTRHSCGLTSSGEAYCWGCQRRSKRSQLWRLKMSHPAGDDEPQIVAASRRLRVCLG